MRAVLGGGICGDVQERERQHTSEAGRREARRAALELVGRVVHIKQVRYSE